MGRTACTEPQCLYTDDLYLYLIQHEHSICCARVAGQQIKIQRTTVSLDRKDNLQAADTAHSNYRNSEDVTIHSEAEIRHSNLHRYSVDPIAIC